MPVHISELADLNNEQTTFVCKTNHVVIVDTSNLSNEIVREQFREVYASIKQIDVISRITNYN